MGERAQAPSTVHGPSTVKYTGVGGSGSGIGGGGDGDGGGGDGDGGLGGGGLGEGGGGVGGGEAGGGEGDRIQMSLTEFAVMSCAVQEVDPRHEPCPISKETQVGAALHFSAHSCKVVVDCVSQSSLRPPQAYNAW